MLSAQCRGDIRSSGDDETEVIARHSGVEGSESHGSSAKAGTSPASNAAEQASATASMIANGIVGPFPMSDTRSPLSVEGGTRRARHRLTGCTLRRRVVVVRVRGFGSGDHGSEGGESKQGYRHHQRPFGPGEGPPGGPRPRKHLAPAAFATPVTTDIAPPFVAPHRLTTGLSFLQSTRMRVQGRFRACANRDAAYPLPTGSRSSPERHRSSSTAGERSMAPRDRPHSRG